MSFFRKLASPLMSSIFRKGVGGLTSLFKKAPSLIQVNKGLQRASSTATKLANNPVLEGLANQSGYGNQFNLAKRGANRLEQVAGVGDKVVDLRGKALDLRRDARAGQVNSGNILERVKAVKDDAMDIKSKVSQFA